MATKSKRAMRITGIELNRALAAGEFNADPRGSTPDDVTAFIKAEIAKWETVIRGANIQVD
jgi:tripartite-type tricarboxylate transporter receptor subunit TctC